MRRRRVVAPGTGYAPVGSGLPGAALAVLLALVLAGCGTDTPPPGPADSTVEPETTSAPGPAAKDPVIEDGALLTTDAHRYSEVGGVVDGFPSDLLPVPDGAEVLVSSAVPVGLSGAVEVSLNLRSPLSPEELLEVYRASLGAAGFTEVSPDLIQDGLSAETTFTRSTGDELLVIGVLDVDGLRTVTIGGRLRTDA